jgi:RNA polymerase II subunit A small phosphatase-like protein
MKSLNSNDRSPTHLLEEQEEECLNRKTLVLDLDETLVHSSFKTIPDPDIILPVTI